ncbi:hypothetical protein WSM22_20130 [Cytophagales bacterium WSM2-2]|nr:hypothetical protein WSM22_20130 [Cytophagales bacterium WSM2-2]
MRLSDLTTSTSERLVLNLLLSDVTHTDLHIRLRLRIESQNIKLETPPEYFGSPITLQGGTPLRLSNLELAEYFQPDHLAFSGISRSEFQKTGFLPEGLYQFCFEVYEYNRGVKISSPICATAWLILNDPPLINLPRNGEKIKPLSPQNIIFQWTPRHTSSPNAAFTTEYEIKVVEVWPSNRNPNDAILSQPAIYETTTHSTSLVYGPDATQLEPGRTYAFRVQARPAANAEGLDLFKNNGYSEVVSFVYGDICDPPINITALAEIPNRISLSWDASPSQTAYTVQYRVKNSSDAHWYSNTALIPAVEITGLLPHTAYEYQAMATCGSFESVFGNTASITTPDLPEKSYTCGAPLEDFNLDPSKLLPILKIGEVIHAGDFDVIVTKVTGAVGTFSGEGIVTVPFFNQARTKVAFENIVVNTDHRMVKGFINITGGAIEVVPTAVLNAMDELLQVLDVVDSAMIIARQYVVDKPDPYTFVAEQTVTVSNIDRVYRDASGKIIVVDSNGKTQTLPGGKDLAIVDKQGNGVIVNKNGGITNTTANQALASAKRELNLNVTFAKATDTNFGFDELKSDALKSNYQKLGNEYFVPWKAVASGLPDPVTVIYKGSVPFEKITFEQDGIPVKAALSGGTINLNVNPVLPKTTSSLIAKIIPSDTSKKEQILGKLNVVGYEGKTVNLQIIPVNEAEFSVPVEDIKKHLDKIYSQAVVKWNMSIATKNLNVDKLSKTFDDGNSGLLSNYTNDMKNVINTYGDIQPETYYLFLIDKPASGNKLGFMPRSKQVGFIFTTPHGNDIPRLANTMAHELGHGAFTLKHTFVDYPALTQGSTGNLLDYNNGTQLLKYQWDQIHEPAVVLGLFQSDEAGALVNTVQGTPVAMLGDSTLKNGKPFLYQSSGKQMKMKFETALTTQAKIAFRLTMEIETSQVKINYPNTGYDSLTYNQVKTITLDSLPEAKYTFLCKSGNTEFRRVYYIRKKKFEITKEQLKAVFPNTDNKKIEDVVKAINENSLLFGITSKKRMSHFIGQIGAETGGLVKLKEEFNYTAKNVFDVFLKPNLRNNGLSTTGKTFWFCDLIEGYDCTSLDVCVGTNQSMADCGTAIPVKLKDGKCAWAYVNFDSTYNVKTNYVADASLFDYVYGCRMDNGGKSTKDGSTYLGKGFIHITGKSGYKALSQEWNRLYPDDKKEFHGADISLLETDVTVAIKASLVFWKLKNLNSLADEGTGQNTIDNIGKKVNGSGSDLPNGYPARRSYSKSAFDNLN